MGRTKWKNRTPEDQQRILEEQKKMHENGRKQRMKSANPFSLLYKIRMTNEHALEIYNNKAIPIICKNHGWVESEKYILGKMKHILTGDHLIDAVMGKCPHCGEDIVRAFPPKGTDEIMLFALCLTFLIENGRMTDNRQKDDGVFNVKMDDDGVVVVK
jgi:hypothetical protein